MILLIVLLHTRFLIVSFYYNFEIKFFNSQHEWCSIMINYVVLRMLVASRFLLMFIMKVLLVLGFRSSFISFLSSIFFLLYVWFKIIVAGDLFYRVCITSRLKKTHTNKTLLPFFFIYFLEIFFNFDRCDF